MEMRVYLITNHYLFLHNVNMHAFNSFALSSFTGSRRWCAGAEHRPSIMQLPTDNASPRLGGRSKQFGTLPTLAGTVMSRAMEH